MRRDNPLISCTAHLIVHVGYYNFQLIDGVCWVFSGSYQVFPSMPNIFIHFYFHLVENLEHVQSFQSI